MATDNGSLNFGGAGETRHAGRGRYFLLAITSGAPVTLRFKQPNRGAGIVLENVSSIKVGPVEDESYWERVEIVSTGASVGTFINGDDPVDFANAVTLIGSLTVSRPANGGQGNASITNAANGVQIRPANAARRVVHVFNNAPVGGDTIFAGYGAALVATDGIPIPPQQERSFLATPEVRAIALVAGPINVRWQEELD